MNLDHQLERLRERVMEVGDEAGDGSVDEHLEDDGYGDY